MKVETWCSEHGITKANYYYRLKRVRKACLEVYNPEPVSYTHLVNPAQSLPRIISSKSLGQANIEEIKSSLGLGVVRFHEAPPEEPEISTYDYEYRTNTEVITAVEVSGCLLYTSH